MVSDFAPMTSDALAILRLGEAERDARSLWSLLNDKCERLAPADAEVVRRLIGVVERARQRVGRMPLADVLLLAVEESGWDLRLLAGGNVGRDAFANVLKFARQATAFEESVGTGPAGFALHLDAKERLGDTEAPASLADDGSDAVRLMSIHASKGLEFPIVVVPGLAANPRGTELAIRASRRGGGVAIALKTPAGDDGEPRRPSAWFSAFSQEAAEADADESARVLYVACTRAREMLLVSGAMGLRPAKGTSAKNDLVRLSRVLGVGIPVGEPSDSVVTLPDSGVACRVRVIDAGGSGRTAATAADAAPEGQLLPPAGEGRPQVAARKPAPERISYTQLSEFERCPKRFWIRRVRGVRPFGPPASDKADPLQFGIALHSALRLVGRSGEAPSAQRIATIARFNELGATDAVRLAQVVARYCESALAKRVAEGNTVRRESPFSMQIGGRFLLTGSIDLYARTGDTALVVDYKSGETGEVGELADRYRLQAECYALAALRDGCSAVSVEFVRPEVARTEGDVQTVAFEFSAADADRIETELVHRYAEIESSAFGPNPSKGCFTCDVPSGLCPQRGGRDAD